MFLHLDATQTRQAVWINLAQIRTAVIAPNRQEIKLTFANKSVMIFDAEDIPSIRQGLNKLSIELDAPEPDIFAQIMNASEELLDDLSDEGTPEAIAAATEPLPFTEETNDDLDIFWEYSREPMPQLPGGSYTD